ncbi:MAG: PD40 domain-containing protein, partial [Chitinophagaceae bacterium]|nr:PD40 domain-containing protein [Chitinophagaceae bacterium]
MNKFCLLASILFATTLAEAQSNLTPEKLWSLGRVSAQGMSADKKMVYYSVSIPDINENKSKTKFYEVPLAGGNAKEIAKVPGNEEPKVEQEGENIKVSPDGKKVVFTREVKLQAITGMDRYNLPKSNVLVYDNLNQRHWDTWEDGSYAHVFVADLAGGYAVKEKDIMANELFDCPQKPHGGAEDLIFTPDSKQVIYVTKKQSGMAYAISTNTDLYAYSIEQGTTTNLTEGMMGYDTNPAFSEDGKQLAWLSMKTENCESDKNEVWVMDWSSKEKVNLTAGWDETVASFQWADDGQKIFFVAPYHGTEQLFEIDIQTQKVKQLTSGQFDVTSIVAQAGNLLVVSRTDMNHAAELFGVDINTGKFQAITHVNDANYAQINLCKVSERYTELENGDRVF